MLRNLQDMKNYTIGATDGAIGHVKDFYFDDQAWTIRYFVVDTGGWLSSRKVLISPMSLAHPDWAAGILPASITREQVKNSPDIDTDKPVSRQHEADYLGYYGYPYYWGGSGIWGAHPYPGLERMGLGDLVSTPSAVRHEQDAGQAQTTTARHAHDDPHLRSCEAVAGYRIEATDGEIGHLQGLLVDDDTWTIRYLIVDAGTWWDGHEVLIAPQWIRDVSSSDSKVTLSIARQAVRDAPPYDPDATLEVEREPGVYARAAVPGATAGPPVEPVREDASLYR